jgi:hypothetical protein
MLNLNLVEKLEKWVPLYPTKVMGNPTTFMITSKNVRTSDSKLQNGIIINTRNIFLAIKLIMLHIYHDCKFISKFQLC